MFLLKFLVQSCGLIHPRCLIRPGLFRTRLEKTAWQSCRSPMCSRYYRGQVVAFKTPFRPSGMARADALLQSAITNKIIRYGSISRMNGDIGAPTV